MSHASLAATAERLIAKHGRTMSLRKISRTPGDTDKPWRGPDSETTYTFTVDVKAVVAQYEEDELDDQVQRGDMRILVAAKPYEEDLKDSDIVVDGGQVYSVVSGRVIKPGTVKVIYAFQVRQ